MGHFWRDQNRFVPVYESSGGVGVAVTFGAGVHQVFLTPDSTQFPTAGGSTVPGGSNTQVQFNDSGAFGGDAGLTYNKATDVLTAVGGFVGPLTGNVTGNVTGSAGSAAVATLANTVPVTDAAADATTWPMLAGTQTGNQAPLTDAGLSYNANTNALTAGFFVGDGSGLTGLPSPGVGTVTHTGALTADQVVVGNGSADVKILPSASDATKFLNGAATPAYAQVKDSDLSTSNITTNNVTTAKHGFAPILPNDATKYLDGTGAYSVPPGGSASDYLGTLTGAEISITGAVTATISRQHAISGTSASYTITLPAVAGNTGKFISFRVAQLASASKLYTLDGNGSETIDGALTRILWAGESCVLYCNGTAWFKIAGKTLPMLCTMRINAIQTGVLPSTVTKCNVNQADADNTGMMANVGSSRIDVLRPGTVMVYGAIIFVGLAGNATRVFSSFTQNGVTLPVEPETFGVLGGYASPFGCLSTPAAAGDYIELYGFQSGGSTEAFYSSGATGSAASVTVQEMITW